MQSSTCRDDILKKLDIVAVELALYCSASFLFLISAGGLSDNILRGTSQELTASKIVNKTMGFGGQVQGF